MTVIAWDGKTLAADSQLFAGDFRAAIMNKVGRTADGWLWGVTGSTGLKEMFVTWVETREGDPKTFNEDKCDMVLISPEGVVKEWNGEGWTVALQSSIRAWGAGLSVALGALEAGADAVKAVEIACKRHVFCGGPVTFVSLASEDDEPVLDLAEPIPWENDPSVAEWRRNLGLR